VANSSYERVVPRADGPSSRSRAPSLRGMKRPPHRLAFQFPRHLRRSIRTRRRCRPTPAGPPPCSACQRARTGGGGAVPNVERGSKQASDDFLPRIATSS
jgi:hypothetical protein